jgi:hypothetical protein
MGRVGSPAGPTLENGDRLSLCMCGPKINFVYLTYFLTYLGALIQRLLRCAELETERTEFDSQLQHMRQFVAHLGKVLFHKCPSLPSRSFFQN